jgi:hypothetical protein
VRFLFLPMERSNQSKHIAHDVRQGAHARKVLESYQTWSGEGPELSVLRLLGLFDRPADEKALGALLNPPAILSLTESLTDLRPTEWRTILAKLRRARLLAGEDPHNPGQLDTHPLVREYFGEQLRSQETDAWKECNKRLFHYYRTLAPKLPVSFKEMQPSDRATRIIQSVTAMISIYRIRHSLKTMKLDDWLTRLVAVPPGRSPLANGLAIGTRIALFILILLGIIAAIAIVLLHR